MPAGPSHVKNDVGVTIFEARAKWLPNVAEPTARQARTGLVAHGPVASVSASPTELGASAYDRPGSKSPAARPHTVRRARPSTRWCGQRT